MDAYYGPKTMNVVIEDGSDKGIYMPEPQLVRMKKAM